MSVLLPQSSCAIISRENVLQMWYVAYNFFEAFIIPHAFAWCRRGLFMAGCEVSEAHAYYYYLPCFHALGRYLARTYSRLDAQERTVTI